MSSDLFFYTSSDDEDEVNSELAMFTEACQAAYEASKPKLQRTPVERDCYGAHDRLVMVYFFEHPQYDEATFPWYFIIDECTFAIRQMAYGAVPDSLDENLQMGATTACKSLQIFCKVIMNLYGEEFLRKPTYTDMEKLYAYHNEKHGFPGMGGHGPDPFILLEAIASNDLWIWHSFFGVSGMNNNVNVLRQSPLFNDLKSGRAPDVPFVANNVPYKRGYYLTDGIYPQWKDVERPFGVLKLKWKLIKYPARGMTQNEQHRNDDPIRTHAKSMQVTQEIVDRTAHLSLKADLVEHIWNNAN
ncbi:putative nuclease HARBI1 [Tanacetum coccineum]